MTTAGELPADERSGTAPPPELVRPLERFQTALERLENAPAFARRQHVGRVFDAAEQLLSRPGGAVAAYRFAARFESAGVFADGDWDAPERLQASFVPTTFSKGDRWTITLECLSLLRLLSIAEGAFDRPGLSSEQALNYLRDVLALCLDYVFERTSEADRQSTRQTKCISEVVTFIAETIGYDTLLEQLVEEVWRLLRQRPIRVDPIRLMVTKLSLYCFDKSNERSSVPVGAERLISALYGPTPASREDPGVDAYRQRLTTMDAGMLNEEATASARAMYDTGLVSPYHAVLLRQLLVQAPDLLGTALGLSSTGVDCGLTYRGLLHTLIEQAIHPETCQSIYGLAGLLERGVLHIPGLASSLWRQVKLPLCETAARRIERALGTSHSADVFLLAGVLSILGQPLGVGQGDNPTCQSARALSMWAYSDPNYLLQLLAWAARDDGITMTFHGREISSARLPDGGAGSVGSDLGTVSLVLVPHLDRVYAEMMRQAHSAGQDPHIHVNPEFHGWQVGRGFAIAVDVESGRLKDFEQFIRLFYACYHPAFNGGQPVIHPQPVGLAVTDSSARFVGWHAVTLLRVALDMQGMTRVYFYNPNNDSGQNWGDGVVVSTEGNGEVHGESSLPVEQFASRLYLFHFDPLEVGNAAAVAESDVAQVKALGETSWAALKLEEATA